MTTLLQQQPSDKNSVGGGSTPEHFSGTDSDEPEVIGPKEVWGEISATTSPVYIDRLDDHNLPNFSSDSHSEESQVNWRYRNCRSSLPCIFSPLALVLNIKPS